MIMRFSFLIFFMKAYIVGTHLNCIDLICLYKEVDKKYTGCNLKTKKLLDSALIGVCAVIRLNTVFEFEFYSPVNTVNEALPGVLGYRVIRPFILGEQGNKSLKLKGTGEQRQFWETGNIENQDFGKQGKLPIFFRGTREQILPSPPLVLLSRWHHPCQGASDGYPHHMCLWRLGEK